MVDFRKLLERRKQMALWYSEPKDFKGNASEMAPFGQLSNMEPETINVRLIASEATFRETDTAWVMYGVFDSVNEKVGSKVEFVAGTLFYFEIHKGDWEKNKKDGEKWVKVPVAQTAMEKFYCEVFEERKELLTENYYKVVLNLQNNEMLFTMHNAGTVNLHTIEPAFYSFEKVEPNKLKDVAIPELKAKGKGGWGGSKGQTEAEKLNDRLTFLEQQFQPGSRLTKFMLDSGMSESSIESVREQLLFTLFS
jgi:hypothetical protein